MCKWGVILGSRGTRGILTSPRLPPTQYPLSNCHYLVSSCRMLPAYLFLVASWLWELFLHLRQSLEEFVFSAMDMVKTLSPLKHFWQWYKTSQQWYYRSAWPSATSLLGWWDFTGDALQDGDYHNYWAKLHGVRRIALHKMPPTLPYQISLLWNRRSHLVRLLIHRINFERCKEYVPYWRPGAHCFTKSAFRRFLHKCSSL